MQNVNATKKFYDYLVSMERHFNSELFDGALRPPLFTLKRGLGSLAYFSPGRWKRGSNTIGEIALNPTLFADQTWLSLMQTIVHQQCHLWQHQFGEPSRPSYHNIEWAVQMEDVGLMPSVTGEPGGKKTGQHISEYPLPNGPFIRACANFVEMAMTIPLVGRFSHEAETAQPVLPLDLPEKTLTRLCSPIGVPTQDAEIVQQECLRAAKRKVKYSCPKCGASVWGRNGLALKCQGCRRLFRVVDA